MANDHRLNHYLVYDVADQRAGAEVLLQGQFDKEPIKTYVGEVTCFANPVQKIHAGGGAEIIDKHAHLAWHKIKTESEPVRAVRTKNQFGRQGMEIGDAVALLAPAEKIERGSQFPKELDHYKLYKIRKCDRAEAVITLKDQFQSLQTPVGPPKYFGVPVHKWHEGRQFNIHNPEEHLLFYGVKESHPKESRGAEDQFGKYELEFGCTVLVGVPTLKKDWKVIEG